MSRLVERMENPNVSNIGSLKRSLSHQNGGNKSNIPRIVINDRNAIVRNQIEVKNERERHHVHHKKNRVGIPDYTSATTGTFSDCIFDNQSPNNNDDNKVADVDKSVARNIDISEISLGNHINNKHSSAPSSSYANRLIPITPNKHKHHKSKNGEDPRSVSFNSDKKRLVNEFLESMAPPTDASHTKISNELFPPSRIPSTTNSIEIFGINSMTNPLHPNDSQRSLQTPLYQDLEHEQTKYGALPGSKLASVSLKSSASRTSVLSTSSSSSDSNEISSCSTVSSFDSVNQNHNTNDSNLVLDFNDADYYQQHIAMRLNKIEMMMKTSLKESILKRETDFEKTIADFDKVNTELEALRNRVVRLKSLVSEKYMIRLAKDFDLTDPNSYESKLTLSVHDSVHELERLEKRMTFSKDRLNEQKELVKRLDNLIFVETSIISTKKSQGMFSKYKYIVYDSLTIVFIVIAAVLFKRFLSTIKCYISA